MRKIILTLCLSALTLPLLALELPKIAMIVAKDSSLGEISLLEIRLAYLGQRQFIGKEKVKPVMHGNDQLSSSFFALVLGYPRDFYKKLWAKKALQDGMGGPKVLLSSQDILRQVAGNKAALGFVEADKALAFPGVKVVYQTP